MAASTNSTLSREDYKDWKIILKNESAQQLVLYNESDKSLQVQHESIGSCSVKVCKECGRPYDSRDIIDNNAFMDRNYFRLLDISSRQNSPPAIKSSLEKRKLSSSSSRSSSNSSNSSIDEFHPKNLSDSSINQGYYRRFFKEDQKLGRGAGGSVYKCQHVLDGIELGAYAVKKVPVGDNHSWLNRMLREVHMLENLRHPNIIEYKHAWLEYHQLTQFGPAIPCLFILMQLAEGGNLEEFILNNRENISIQLCCGWFEQICQGLAHLHRCGILHRDLKPSNILLKPQDDGNVQLLITDFGECASMNEGSTNVQNRTGATGTIEFVAPELLKVDRKSGKFLYLQSKTTDIWSLGLIFYFMLTGKLPYSYADIEDIDTLKSVMCSLNQVILPKEANKLPKGFKKALASMLQVDPELRPTIEQVLILIRDGPIVEKQNQQLPQQPPNFKRRLSLPPPPPAFNPTPTVSASTQIDENTRISLALFMMCISVIPTYPTIPSLRRVILALGFTFVVLKSNKQRTAFLLAVTYSLLIIAFYFNKID